MTTRRVVGGVNLGVRFLLELASLASLVAWGLRLDAAWPVRLLAGVLLPLAAASCWGLFASPKARFTTAAGRLVCEVGLFGGAAVALVATGWVPPGVVLAVVAAASLTVTYALGQHRQAVQRARG
ncbi:YrdB family protein [Actinocatenispora sera]|uniref:YrdB family protein n=1 Tax=Actinocatenispora sera TaxID=390989 RepID=UPI0034101D9D